MTKTKQKETNTKNCGSLISRGLRAAQKPETPVWALLDVKPITGAHGRKLFMLSNPLVPLAGMVANPSEVKALRAAQPKLKCEKCGGVGLFALCFDCAGKVVVAERAEGMAQGKKGEREAFKASFGWAADVKYWLAKCVELEREAPKK